MLDLKQKQANVIEARSARKEVKASSDQTEASVSLAYEAVKQGRSIMIFTIVTIVFVGFEKLCSKLTLTDRKIASSFFFHQFVWDERTRLKISPKDFELALKHFTGKRDCDRRLKNWIHLRNYV